MRIYAVTFPTEHCSKLKFLSLCRGSVTCRVRNRVAMSLLTVERNSPSPQESDAEETLSSSSHEEFVAREHYVTSLPPRPWASLGRHGGEQLRIFTHLKKVMKLLRNSDTIKLAVELENSSPRKVTKHLVLVATNGYQDTEEAIVLGTEQEDSIIRLGLVLPLWRDTEIKLDGDGGFIVHGGDRQAVFKPSSVQSMWTTLQSLYQSTENARLNNYYVGGLSHTWMTFYQSQLTDDHLIRNEWNLMKDVETFRPDSPIYSSQITTYRADNVFERELVSKLRGIMLHEDLEEVTSRQLRRKLEAEVDMQLDKYREFLDRHMLRILGQMEQPSQILDYLYLGSEWNASNLSELKELGVGYILNVTREIDNFYPEVFKYLNIRLYDVPDSELIKHWEKTYRFIKEAKMMDTKVLVHCKMGISRSAATVIAYMMKEYQMPLMEAKKHVKSMRGCINPNEGFMGQLRSYEGILTARHNPRWGRHAPTRLYSKRSMSDPDIMQSLEKEELERGMKREGEEEGGREWEGGEAERQFMHTRPIHNVASEYNIPNLLQSEESTKLTLLPEEEASDHAALANPDANTSQSTADCLGAEKNACVHSTPVDKSRNVKHYLASLPVVIGSTDDGIGDNIPTSNSGSAYSSPMYSPPDEESIHMHIAQHREQLMRKEEEEATAAIQQQQQQQQQGEASAGRALEEDSVGDSEHTQQQSQQASKESPRAQLTPKSSPPPPKSMLSSPPSSNTTGQCLQQEAVVGVVNMPVSHSHRSNSLPYALSVYAVRDDSSGASAKKTKTVSPTNSRQNLSSFVRRSPAVLEHEEGEEEREDKGGESQRSTLQGDGSQPEEGTLAGEGRLAELHSDDAQENMSPRTRERFMQHRRTKSDSHDISGPIKTAQIFSVPERVKEIEEKGLQVTAGQPLQVVTQADTQSCPSDNRLSVTSSASSEECLAPSLGDTTTDGENLSTSRRPSSSPAAATRHASLSPKPSNAATTIPSSHLPVETSVSLPSSMSPPELESGSPPPVISQEELVNSLQGVVKAKVQDIEGKKGALTPQQQTTNEKQAGAQSESCAVVGADAIIKRASLSTRQRPLSEIIIHRPYIGMVEMSPDPGNNSTVPTSSTKEADECALHQHNTASSVRGSEDNTTSQLNRRNTTSEMSSSCSEYDGRDRVQSEALFNAWAGILPTKDLRADDLASVLELRQKFERGSPKEHRKFESNLRRSRSLRDTRLSSPPVRLGGSARLKKHSSNASLLWDHRQRECTSESPPAHGSQRSLSSSVKI